LADGIDLDLAGLDQVVGQFADVLRLRISRIELFLQLDRERVVAAIADAGQRVPETVGDTPGVAAFADHDTLDPQL